MSSTGSAGADRTILEFPAGEAYREVPLLVLGGLASRFELPLERVDDLRLAVESLLMQPPAGETIRLEADATADDLRIRIGPLPPGGLDDPGLRRVLMPLVDGVSERVAENAAWIELTVTAAYRRVEA